jgi:hypothetical protein
MPKNIVSDPTDQEMAFVHLVLSGTMNDRRAAEAVGLNPDSAAYIKSKPRIRAYMVEHRAAVREKLVDQEADLSRLPRLAVEGLRKLSLGRDQILTRLWELATLSSEATRGSIAGQVKALSMIVAIEGLVPDRRLFPSVTQPAATPLNAQIYTSEWRRKDQPAADEQPADPAAAAPPEPVAPSSPEPPLDRNADQLNPFVIPQPLNRVPDATTSFFDVALHTTSSLKLPYSAKPGYFARSR